VDPSLGDLVGFGLPRILCDVASAGAEIAIAYAMQYTPNQNPQLEPLQSSVDLGAVPAGQTITLTASWPQGTAETFPVFDLTAQALLPQRESLRVSWFATDGSFDQDHTGRGPDEDGTSTDNLWTAPSAPGSVHLWVVLRDSRGGVDFLYQAVTVTP
jgi:hypothetical protein